MSSEHIVAHDSTRCPECNSHGTIVDHRTSSSYGSDWDRMRSRTYECWECETRWERYG